MVLRSRFTRSSSAQGHHLSQTVSPRSKSRHTGCQYAKGDDKSIVDLLARSSQGRLAFKSSGEARLCYLLLSLVFNSYFASVEVFTIKVVKSMKNKVLTFPYFW